MPFESHWVVIINRVVVDVRIEVNACFKSERVFRGKPSYFRIVISGPVVMSSLLPPNIPNIYFLKILIKIATPNPIKNEITGNASIIHQIALLLPSSLPCK